MRRVHGTAHPERECRPLVIGSKDSGQDSRVLFRASLRSETVFLNLPVQRAAADVEELRGFFLVPAHDFERALDVGALGVAEGGQSRRFSGTQRCTRVQELDVVGADDPSRCGQRRARDRAFEFPDVAGPGYDTRRSTASRPNALASSDSPFAAQ